VSENLKIRINRTIILAVVLYLCETSSRTLREEHRLSVFENRVLRRILGPRCEVIEGWRKCIMRRGYSPYIITMIKSKRMRWAGHVARRGRSEMHVEYWLESQKERDH
jgi:hypothetical protein